MISAISLHSVEDESIGKVLNCFLGWSLDKMTKRHGDVLL